MNEARAVEELQAHRKATASPILVTGGTGTLGRLVVPQPRDAGRDVRVLSRRSHDAEDGIECLTGDLATDEGIDAAVEGAEIIVAAGDTGPDRIPVPAGPRQRGSSLLTLTDQIR